MKLNNKVPKMIDTIDLDMLAYLSSQAPNFFSARTAKEIQENKNAEIENNKKIELSIKSIQRRLSSLIKKGLVCEGIKTSNFKGYYLSKNGESFLQHILTNGNNLKDAKDFSILNRFDA